MTEQDRKEMQVQFEKETGTKVVNSQGEYDIDYVSWLEAKVFSSNAVLAVTSDSKENKKESEVSLPVEDVNSVIEMLKQHHYTQEEMDECEWDANKIEHLDAHAFDNSVMINLLGGKLDRQ